LFIGILILGALVNYLFSQLVERTGLSGTDRLLGLVFGVVRGLLLIGILVLLGNISEVSKAPWWTSSQLIPQFQPLAHWLQGFVPDQINHLTQLMKSNA
jgi:membrane protein required for colicin V production